MDALRCVLGDFSALLEGPGGSELIASPLNFTTSSKANAELGIRVTLPAGINAAVQWLSAFDGIWAESSSVEDAADKGPEAQHSTASASTSTRFYQTPVQALRRAVHAAPKA